MGIGVRFFQINIVFLILLSYNSISCSETVEVAELRTNEYGGSLGDIDCRMWSNVKDYDWTYYRDEDIVTWAHEGTHSINSRIRNTMNIDNGFYILNGKAVTLSHPNITLRDIAKAVPDKKRGRLYNTYLVKQQTAWNTTPLYCLDELTAYINGTIVAVENKLYKRALESYTNSCEMYEYCSIAYKLCEKRNYSDIEEFLNLMVILQKRLVVIEELLRKDYENGKLDKTN